MRRVLPILTTLGLAALWSDLANACPVCFSGAEENREAFFWTFVLMTSLPLVFMGGTVWWLVRRVRLRDADAIESASAG